MSHSVTLLPGEGLFLRCKGETARDFQDVEYKERIVDNASMQMVMRPGIFDVLLLPNFYGDAVSGAKTGAITTQFTDAVVAAL